METKRQRKSALEQSHDVKIQEVLLAYSRWLEKYGYMDSDWWCETPTAVNRFLSETLPPKKRRTPMNNV